MSQSLSVAIHWYNTTESVPINYMFCLGFDLVLVLPRPCFLCCVPRRIKDLLFNGA